ncbi:GNS1/SUR4 family protein [Colletotrichum godetiae]|uniref:Elongation of fatty acids protein n=1 Tax=Colletotrichum godetiae TaxID=1209918 RepID=A0AAJ0EXZ4_9PEZI|nr:GNS1/SUR4 family protein [Colletotrichum godetiae]KAK1675654.1 GNS1/SUR4 family protein [Colletotrichum godetiae]
MAGVTVLGELPSASLFTFPPDGAHMAIPPPFPGSISAAPPVEIPDHIFTAALDPRVPITIAALYAVTVKLLNKYNNSTNRKPWGISKTKPFFAFVVLHNVFLAVYSAWTFWGMLGGMRRSVVSPFGPNGLAATADSFCQLNGNGGFGAATVYNETVGYWSSLTGNNALGFDGRPSREATGRIWNEGLAFYGWIFYLSKFYEVLDTFIILAKGKLSSTLQTYHHAGAMMCMWAGMRYMSAPIWMFVLVNSFIHAMMYTYYTITAFNIRVPMAIKRTLTTLQITQFLVGATYAMAHSFVSYTVPVTVYTAKKGADAITQSSTSTAAETVATAATGAFEALKDMVFGASAKVAEEAAAVSVAAAAAAPPQPGFVAETIFVTQPCVTTSGETFAIWLNVLYLAPLTYLFVMFFIRSYIRRSTAAPKGKGKARRESNVTLAEKAGWDAAREVNREIYNGSASYNVEGSPKRAGNGKAKH